MENNTRNQDQTISNPCPSLTTAILIVNYCRAGDTLECLNSLSLIKDLSFRVFLADNGSGSAETTILSEYAAQHPTWIQFITYPHNSGFTGAYNRLLTDVLAMNNYSCILLLNNDVVVEPGFLARMLMLIDPARRIEMVAARVMKYADREKVDNLGITFYKCGLASNRKSPDDPLLGPSGSCALYTADLLRQVHRATHEYFDEYFFCYAEDTDLAWRATLLGYRAIYAADAWVYHKGSISSGGPNSDFVLYHGIRNSLCVLVKDIPLHYLLRNIFWILILHCAILLRYAVNGKIRIIFRLYRDFIHILPGMLSKRLIINKQVQIPNHVVSRLINKNFYERNYVLNALHDLVLGIKERLFGKLINSLKKT